MRPKILKLIYLLLAPLIVISAAACSKQPYATIRYSPNSDPSIELKQVGSTWSITVDKKDVTSTVGLEVKLDPQVGQGNLNVLLTKATVKGLPPNFSLQETTGLATQCLQCPENFRSWTRTASKETL